MSQASVNKQVSLAFYTRERDAAPHQSKKNNWTLLWETLEAISVERRPDYSVKSVGKRLHAAGGMTTQSLRNKGGADMRRLIDMYASAVAKTDPNDKLRQAGKLALIEDPGVRVAMGVNFFD